MKALRKYRNIIKVPKRLYKYGTTGLFIHDDRTWKEKLCDKIDGYLRRLELRWHIRKRSKAVWHSWFDVSTGTWITSMADIRRIEKEKGLVFTSFSDIDKEVAFQNKEKERKFRRDTRKYFGNAMRDIQQGRSFVKEINDRINKGDYKIGEQQCMN